MAHFHHISRLSQKSKVSRVWYFFNFGNTKILRHIISHVQIKSVFFINGSHSFGKRTLVLYYSMPILYYRYTSSHFSTIYKADIKPTGEIWNLTNRSDDIIIEYNVVHVMPSLEAARSQTGNNSCRGMSSVETFIVELTWTVTVTMITVLATTICMELQEII